MSPAVVRLCAGCEKPLESKHLRTQLAPPDSKWHEVRTHDLTCLVDFLEGEEDKIAAGEDGVIFKVSVTPRGGTRP